ncbi:MAG: hypothetical protein Ct9H300mP3_00740 [Gammaproteobacteria bacterium]|nr:MAG: hypothetical protein Ct9H300mP3_00740 [Gammaproteobacteria bacterium]
MSNPNCLQQYLKNLKIFDASKFTVSGYEPHPDQAHAIPTRIDDMTIPHIASPDVHVDEAGQEIIMYYHGLEKFGGNKRE